MPVYAQAFEQAKSADDTALWPLYASTWARDQEAQTVSNKPNLTWPRTFIAWDLQDTGPLVWKLETLSCIQSVELEIGIVNILTMKTQFFIFNQMPQLLRYWITVTVRFSTTAKLNFKLGLG